MCIFYTYHLYMYSIHLFFGYVCMCLYTYYQNHIFKLNALEYLYTNLQLIHCIFIHIYVDIYIYTHIYIYIYMFIIYIYNRVKFYSYKKILKI